MREHLGSRRPLIEAIAERWWIPMVRGFLAVLLGVAAFAWPGATLSSLLVGWAAFAIADGAMAALAGLTRSGTLIAIGLITMAAGVFALIQPRAVLAVLVFVIACWAVVRGLVDVAEALAVRRELPHEWLMLVNGILTLLFGIWILAVPRAGARGIVWLAGAYSLLHGILLLCVGWRVRRIDHLFAAPTRA